MEKLFTKNVILNDIPTTLNIVKAPQTSRKYMPKNRLGFYVGPDGQLYKPVFVFGNTYMDKETLRDFVWHAIRNLQRRYNPKHSKMYKDMTRRLYQIHTLLVGEDKYNEKLVRAMCEDEGLEILLNVMQEEQKPYKSDRWDVHYKFEGIRLDGFDLIDIFREAGLWFNWESQQPDQEYRKEMLTQNAVTALYAFRILAGGAKKYFPEIIAEFMNTGRSEGNEISQKTIKKMMKANEIPVAKKK